MNEEHESLIEFPESLLKNPPEPKRKDIAKLFEKIINDDNNKNIFENASKDKSPETLLYYFEYTKEKEIKIYRGYRLTGIITDNNYKIYKIIKVIIKYFEKSKSPIYIDKPKKSKYINYILNWISKSNVNSVELNYEKRHSGELLIMTFKETFS